MHCTQARFNPPNQCSRSPVIAMFQKCNTDSMTVEKRRIPRKKLDEAIWRFNVEGEEGTSGKTHHKHALFTHKYYYNVMLGTIIMNNYRELCNEETQLRVEID